ncbi:transposase InsO family protein [Bradyrhizobium liaoningense]
MGTLHAMATPGITTCGAVVPGLRPFRCMALRWSVWSNQPGTGGIKSYPHEAVEFATLEWVDWFNNRRLLEPIGNIPPAEAEQRYYAMLEQSAMAA